MSEFRFQFKTCVFPLFLFLAFCLSSCVVTKEEVVYLNDQIVALNSRVDKLQQTVDKKLESDMESKIEPIRVNQAEMGAELDKVKEQIQAISGRVQDNNLLIKRIVEKDTTPVDTLRAEVSDLGKRIDKIEKNLEAIQSYLGIKVSMEENKVEVQKAEPGEKKAVEIEKTTPVQGVVTPSLEEDLYYRSLDLYKKAKYEEAIDGFRDFLKKYPKSDLADNAQFWIGESYMALKQYEKAILAFQKVIEKYPNGNKVPNAMLRQAVAFYEIKDKVSSRLLLKKIIKKYPNSNEAKVAKVRLNSFK